MLKQDNNCMLGRPFVIDKRREILVWISPSRDKSLPHCNPRSDPGADRRRSCGGGRTRRRLGRRWGRRASVPVGLNLLKLSWLCSLLTDTAGLLCTES